MELHLRWWADTVATTQAAQLLNQLTTQLHSNEASTQSVSSNQQSSNTNVEAVSAPKLLHTQLQLHHLHQLQLVVQLKAQFLANGGTEAAWNAIVMPESGGNLTQLTQLVTEV